MVNKILIFLLQFIITNTAFTQIPDLIYHNGTIITMEEAMPSAEAIAISGDTILAVGSNDEILGMKGQETQLVNLQGFTMLPGFNDSHCHWFSWREHRCDLREEVTYPELEEIMPMLSRNGWTSISELNFGRPDYAPEHLNNALDLEGGGELSVRVNGYWGTLEAGSELIVVLEDSMRTPDKIYSERVKAPGVKIYVDNPFGDYDNWSQEEVNEMVQKAHVNGWQVAAHAVNESALEKIVTAFENVLGDESNENYRHRVEHAVKVTNDQLARMKAKGIITSFQLLGPADWPTQETFASRFLGSNPEWTMRWNDLLNAESDGARNTGSTDAPFNEAPCDYSPFTIIYQAVTRKGYIDRALSDWELAQRLTVEQCLKLLTIDGAYATFDEDLKGSLKTGKYADLIVVSDNPLEIATPEDLLNINILLTMVGGEVEYCDESTSLCSPTRTFSINGVSITASNFLPDQTPDLAFDGNPDTNWGSGDDAPQWIEFDLMKEVVISKIELLVDQFPEGTTTHLILAKGEQSGEAFSTLHQFNEKTTFGQTLAYTAPSDLPAYRYFRILTLASPSWVSWKEVVFHEKDLTEVAGSGNRPSDYMLNQNYPNPFNPVTLIKYALPEKAFVEMNVYDIRGRKVAELVAQNRQVGFHNVVFDASKLPSGVYVYQMKTPARILSRKMVLIK